MTDLLRRIHVILLVAMLASATAITLAQTPAATAPVSSSLKYEKEIAAFEAADTKSPPPQGAVLFIGDSGIRMWKTLAEDFSDEKVINRGFGGSQIADSTYFADRIVIPYKPRLIIIRAGGNDLTAGRTPDQLLADFKAFVEKVREKLPDTRIAIFSLNPNPARWSQAQTRKKANVLIKTYVDAGKNLDFIEVWTNSWAPTASRERNCLSKTVCTTMQRDTSSTPKRCDRT